MRALIASLAIAAITASTPSMASTPAMAGGQSQLQNNAAPGRAQGIAARPAPGTAATIAAGTETIVAWSQPSAGGDRVLARTGDAHDVTVLGPQRPGGDGAPAAVAPGDGSVWVVSSRGDATGRKLWSQRWADGAWQEPSEGPAARPYDHHPALAAAPSSQRVWAVWLGEDNLDRNATMLYASTSTGAGWSAAEPLPRSVGIPMAPAIAVDRSGTPYVAWAASDGADAEIWVSKRSGGRWSSPAPLSRNLVPDITPSIAATANGLLVTWISYTDEGYVPMALTGDDIDDWSEPIVLDPNPGGRPHALSNAGLPAVAWRKLSDGPTGGTITSRTLRTDGWSAPTALADASGSAFTVAEAPDGRLLLAFSRPDGSLGVVDDADPQQDGLSALAAAGAARFGDPSSVGAAWPGDPSSAGLAGSGTPPSAAQPQPSTSPITTADPPLVSMIAETYTAFGDSITNGVLYAPDRQDSPGYREPLQNLLRAFFGFGTVFNAGVDGETSADGVGRIDNSIQAQNPDVILIMEGTNDIVNVIDIDVTAFNLRRMVQRSYEEKPDIIPFLAQIPPRLDPGPDGFDGPGNGRIDDLNEMIEEIGDEEGADVADMNTPIDGHPELMSNPLHPSAAGYDVMGQTWYDVVLPGVLSRTNRGDLDVSGRTDGLDLVQLALSFGAIFGEPRYSPVADINGDGIIDGFDLDILIEFFGQDVSSAGGSGS